MGRTRSRTRLRKNEVPNNNDLTEEQLTKKSEWQSFHEPQKDEDENWPTNIKLSYLYTRHTVLLFTIIAIVLCYFAYHHHDVDDYKNKAAGIWGCCFFILALGSLVFPSGPFIRPHPIFWRVIFGFSVLYQLLLIMILFQNKAGARQLMTHLDNSLGIPVVYKEYAADCSFRYDLISENLFDAYFVSHFLGWVVKCIMIRDVLLCFVISITWEILEIFFTHMLPNFAECWWDQVILVSVKISICVHNSFTARCERNKAISF